MIREKKQILILAVILSLTITLPFFDYSKIESRFFLFLGEVFGYTGLHLLLWQMILGTRTIFSLWFQDLVFLNNLHKNIGKYGIFLIFLHPFFIFLHYNNFGINILNLSFADEWEIFKALGQFGFYTIVFIWVSSAVFRSKISYRLWKRLHLLSFLVIPLVTVHAIFLASGNTSNLRIYSIFVLVFFVLILVWRLLKASGIILKKTRISKINEICNSTFEIEFESKGIIVSPGQFLYIQLKPFGEAHPYTVSKIGRDHCCITVKLLGDYSRSIHSLREGDSIYIDGPYGVFTKEIYQQAQEDDIVLIVGGIGITPFLEVINNLSNIKKNIFLFYFNKTQGDIAYKNMLEEASEKFSNFKLVHILSNEPQYRGEKGYFNIGLLQKNLDSLDNKIYYVCGPVQMMDIVKSELKNIGVNTRKIFYEKFSN